MPSSCGLFPQDSKHFTSFPATDALLLTEESKSEGRKRSKCHHCCRKYLHLPSGINCFSSTPEDFAILTISYKSRMVPVPKVSNVSMISNTHHQIDRIEGLSPFAKVLSSRAVLFVGVSTFDSSQSTRRLLPIRGLTQLSPSTLCGIC